MIPKKDSVLLSEQHGVNPSIQQCFVCLEDMGLILYGKINHEDTEAPRKVCIPNDVCDKCKEYMTQGVVLISVKKGSDEKNPYRTGGWVVVKEGALTRMLNEDAVAPIREKRVAFVDDETWDTLGLPRGDI